VQLETNIVIVPYVHLFAIRKTSEISKNRDCPGILRRYLKRYYASFALRAKDMAVSPALRAAETAAQKCRRFAKRIDNAVIHVGSLGMRIK
jgi:hypothetical protein